MNIIESIFEAVATTLEEEYPYVGVARYAEKSYQCSFHGVSEPKLIGDYELALSTPTNRLELQFDGIGIIVDNCRIEYNNPQMLDIICGKIYDRLGVRPANPVFTVGL